MASLTAAPELVAMLNELREATEIRDANGEVLGVYTPGAVARAERLAGLFDLEEAEQTLETERHLGRPLKEFWRELQDREAAR